MIGMRPGARLHAAFDNCLPLIDGQQRPLPRRTGDVQPIHALLRKQINKLLDDIESRLAIRTKRRHERPATFHQIDESFFFLDHFADASACASLFLSGR